MCQIQRPAIRLALSIFLLVVFASVTSAYTLVFRDGRRLEVPDDFVVTRVSLTYELSPGFTKTLSVALLDIAATERANHEPAGSFFKHVAKKQDQDQDATEPAQGARTTEPAQRARTTLTNRDLEPYQARRLESEKLYEKRRRELGLPSVEETRRQRDMEESAVLERAREKRDSEARDEAYWRGRARDLRNEIAENDAQIKFVQARLEEVSSSGPVISGGAPVYGPYDRRYPNIYGNGGVIRQYPNGPFPGDNRRIYRRGYPNIYGYPNGYPNVYGYPNIYGYPNGYPNVYGYPNIYGYPNGYPNVYGYPNIYGYPNGQSQVNIDQQSNLTQRLDDLMARRATLNARWLQLEDEARDARIPQIWLEP